MKNLMTTDEQGQNLGPHCATCCCSGRKLDVASAICADSAAVQSRGSDEIREPMVIHASSSTDEMVEIGEYNIESRCESEEGAGDGSSTLLFVGLPTTTNRVVAQEKGHGDVLDELHEDVGEECTGKGELDPAVEYYAHAHVQPIPSSPPLTSSMKEMENYLVSEAHARGIPLPITEVSTWVRHAREATIQRALQTLQTWLRLARQKQGTSSTHGFELPNPLSAGPSHVPGDGTRLGDLALAEKTVKNCDNATTIGGQAVLCLRIGYANLYRLNQRAREQNAHGWGFRETVFRRCYPEFGDCRGLQHLEGAARSALGRLTRGIHFGGNICRFIDRGPHPKAVLFLQPSIPDKFLRRLTATQMQLWADLVYHSATWTSTILDRLWKATALVVNHDVALQSLSFPLEQVKIDGPLCLELGTNQPFRGSIEDLLTPVAVTSSPLLSFQLNVNGGEERNDSSLTETVEGNSRKRRCTNLIDGGNIEECQKYPGRMKLLSCDLPSEAYGGSSFWELNDDFRRAVSAAQHMISDVDPV